MRLIDIETFKLEEFAGPHYPRYAILSHTWGAEEISFQQFNNPTDESRQMAGYKKILGCAEVTRSKTFRYCWVDTCCIDKSSSAELSEAINSMFDWYSKSKLCIIYLSDVDSHDSRLTVEHQMKKSRWFTRGWTLQELIASNPRHTRFHDKNWTKIGTKATMSDSIARITGIHRSCLLREADLSEFSVACRMSWAAKRMTRRPEDVAYCLLGIFQINMPLIYGEGETAFRRLQEEIIRESDDQTIFGWQLSKGDRMRSSLPSNDGKVGVLAQHPAEFADSAHFQPAPLRSGPYNITNKGLSIQLPIISKADGQLIAVLSCYGDSTKGKGDKDPKRRQIAIPIVETVKDSNVYARNGGLSLHMVDEVKARSGTPRAIYLTKAVPGSRRYQEFDLVLDSDSGSDSDSDSDSDSAS
jgi:hypothetical protein